MCFRYFCAMKGFEQDIFDFVKSLDDSALSDEQGAVCVEDANGRKINIVPVELDFFQNGGESERLLEIRKANFPGKTIFLYEDRWLSSGPLVRSMLRTILGRGETVFARNTQVREIPAKVAADFLQRNHLYGSTRSEYRYGLFRTRATGGNETLMGNTSSLIAVATFSAGKHFGHADSYEWIRYASSAGTRVVGGMGKLLSAFLQARSGERTNMDSYVDSGLGKDKRVPVEIMSYADLEWGDGEAYQKLGFEAVADRDCVKFLVDPQTYCRIHADKFDTDRKYRDSRQDGLIEIYNLGSCKYIL